MLIKAINPSSPSSLNPPLCLPFSNQDHSQDQHYFVFLLWSLQWVSVLPPKKVLLLLLLLNLLQELSRPHTISVLLLNLKVPSGLLPGEFPHELSQSQGDLHIALEPYERNSSSELESGRVVRGNGNLPHTTRKCPIQNPGVLELQRPSEAISTCFNLFHFQGS